MKDSRDTISAGIEDFRKKWQLPWEDITVLTGGDILTSLSKHQVLYSPFNWDYAFYQLDDAAAADAILDDFGTLGAKVFREPQFKPGTRIWVAVFSEKTTAPAGPWPNPPETPGWKSPVINRKVMDSAALPGELSPFRFKGEDYLLENVLAHYVNPGTPVGSRSHENHFRIRRESDDRMISIPLLNHYFASAYVWKDRCYCFAMGQTKDGGSIGTHLNEIWSDDLISWSPVHRIFDFTDRNEHFCNTSVTYDGKRFVLLYETDNPSYPIYTFHFAESADLVNWTTIPDAVYAWDKYTGGGSLHWIEEDGMYYLSTLDLYPHPITRKIAYRFILSRSRDLIHWEDAPDDRPIIVPDFEHRPDPERHPDVYEISVSDLEYRQLPDRLKIYYIGGNQWGVCDNQVAEYPGTLREFFHEFYK